MTSWEVVSLIRLRRQIIRLLPASAAKVRAEVPFRPLHPLQRMFQRGQLLCARAPLYLGAVPLRFLGACNCSNPRRPFLTVASVSTENVSRVFRRIPRSLIASIAVYYRGHGSSRSLRIRCRQIKEVWAAAGPFETRLRALGTHMLIWWILMTSLCNLTLPINGSSRS